MAAGDGDTPEPLMSMAEIAELARVKRPVVSNWRRRHADFPRPAGKTSSQLLFSPRGVAEWLAATGRGHDEIRQELALYQLAALAGNYQGPDLIAALTSLLALRSLTDPGGLLIDENASGDVMPRLRRLAARADPADTLLRTEILDMPDDAGWVARRVDELTEAAVTGHLASERIMASRHRFHADPLCEGAVIPELAMLIAGISGARELARRKDSLVLADPAAGDGDLLLALTDLLGEDHEPRCIAAEADPALARLLRRRLAVRGIPLQNVTVAEGTDLPEGPPDPDVLVTRVPYRPGEQLDPLKVLEFATDAALSLREGRFAVVLGPASVLVDNLPTGLAAQRAELLKDDMIEAVIRLPGGCVPYRPGYETAVWVMTQARGSKWAGKVLLADVSDRKLTAGVVQDLIDDAVTWRREGFDPRGHNRIYGVEASVASLVANLGPLLTVRRPPNLRNRRAISSQRVALLTQYGAELGKIGAAESADHPHLLTEILAGADLRPRTESLDNLARQHRLIMRKGTKLRKGDVGPDGHHVVLGPDEILGKRRRGERRIDRRLFVSRHPDARLTEPGDVIVTLTPRPGAIIDWDGYSVTEAPARILRVPRPRPAAEETTDRPAVPEEPVRLTPRVLRFLLLAVESGTRPAGAVRAADRIGDLRLPLLPPGQVKKLEALLEAVDARREAAQREIDMLDEVCHVAASGLTDGTLTVVSDDE